MPEEIVVGGHYKIIRELSKGAFGVTYLAEDTHQPDETLCVVKKLAPHNQDPHILEIAKNKFRKEAKILKKLGCDHSQIPRLHAFFEEQEQFYLVQELIEGHTLTQELSKQWSESEVVELLRDVCSVLGFVHQNKCIHRDIKPSNLMRRYKDGKIVLIDFGAVKEAISQSTVIDTKTIVIGTPGYMPPEQLEGMPQKSSDIYALGITAIELMSGLTAKEVNSQLKATPETQPRLNFLQENLQQVNPQLLAVLEKMTRSNICDRYQNVEDILGDLNDFTNSDKTELVPRRNKFSWLLGCLFLFFFCAAGGAVWYFGNIKDRNLVQPLCPATFDTRVSWGQKYLSYPEEEVSESVEEATENLKSACEAFGDNPEEISISIGKFKAAISYWEEAQELAPENQQIRTYLQNSQLLLHHAKKAKDNPKNYNLRPQIQGLAIPIKITNAPEDAEEMRDFGTQQNIAINMYQANFNETNEQGSLIMIIDDQNDGRDGQENGVKKIVEELKENVPNISVIGHTVSSITKIVIPFYNENQIVLMSASSTAENINPNNSKYFYRVVPSNQSLSKRIFKYIETNLDASQENKIVILYQRGDAYAEDLSNNLQQRLPKSDTIVRQQISGNDSINEAIIRGSNAVILIPNEKNRQEIISSVSAAREEDAIVIGPDSMLNRFTVERVGNSCDTEGLLVFAPYVEEIFSRQVEAYFNSPIVFPKDWRLAYSFAAAKIAPLVQQNLKNGSTQHGIFSTNGSVGTVSFLNNGDRDTSNSPVENFIDIFEVTPECKFRKLD